MKTILFLVGAYLAIGGVFVYLILPSLSKRPEANSGFEILGVLIWPIAVWRTFSGANDHLLK